MTRLFLLALPLSLALSLAACGPADNEPGPGGVTVGEANALDDAAEMLEQRRLPPAALGEGAEPQSSPAEPQQAEPVPAG